jgi:hypothetical protein
MNRLTIKVPHILSVLDYYDKIKVYRDTTEGGSFTTEITGVGTRISILPEYTLYFYTDDTGNNTHWYKTAYYHSVTTDESDKSTAIQGQTGVEKVGYTFENYKPPPGEWGELYTADDMRYTMLFGIDSTAADVAESTFSDAQFRQLVREAMGEFEDYLTMDIRKRVYKTNPSSSLNRAREWREGVDYTDIEDDYDYDFLEWSNQGFKKLRHGPLISVERAIWKNLVNGEIMDLIENNWLRINHRDSTINAYPKGGFTYGPYSVYGPIWTNAAGGRYNQGFEFDYTTGYESSDFVPEGLRSTIAKYATIKTLAVVGDGLLAGFSSQSVSLDGLSESFSSTQSATSAYFGARIKQYSDEIVEWLKKNRYKYSSIPFGFVGV